jgi:hypothetical protein
MEIFNPPHPGEILREDCGLTGGGERLGVSQPLARDRGRVRGRARREGYRRTAAAGDPTSQDHRHGARGRRQVRIGARLEGLFRPWRRQMRCPCPTPCICAAAFAVLVLAVLGWLSERAACAPISTTLPELAVGRPRSAEALDPPGHPRLPPPPPPTPDGAAMPVAT